MFKSFQRDDFKLSALAICLLTVIITVLIITISVHDFYRNINMAKLGYQRVPVLGSSSLQYQKVEDYQVKIMKECGK